MRVTKLSLLALASEVAHGYIDTSPFFMFSTTEVLLPTYQVQSGPKLTSDLVSTLSRCPSDIYLLINQPGVGASDFSTPNSAPALSKYLNSAAHPILRSSVIVPEVTGDVDIGMLERELGSKCGALSTAVDASDFSLSSILGMLSKHNYTTIYTTTPGGSGISQEGTSKQYEMGNIDPLMHIDLKRDIRPQSRKSTSNDGLVDGPLFARYQFLSPGLFMGLLVSLLLLSILYVAISGLASLQVTYAAFDKENNPAAQTKAQ